MKGRVDWFRVILILAIAGGVIWISLVLSDTWLGLAF